jgi:hypothetical protein
MKNRKSCLYLRAGIASWATRPHLQLAVVALAVTALGGGGGKVRELISHTERG